MDLLPRNCEVYYKQPKCKCAGGGWTENYGNIVDALLTPAGKLFYKVHTENQGTFVVPPENIIKVIQ